MRGENSDKLKAAMQVAMTSDNEAVKSALDQLLVAANLAHGEKIASLIEVKHVVEIIESERGWGSRVDEVRYFASKDEAEAFILKYNSDNKPGPAPDWYMYARYGGVKKAVDD